MAIHGIEIKKSREGLLHKNLGVKNGAKLSMAELEKAKASKYPAERKRATFAENARKWNHGKGKESKPRSEKLYGKKD